MQILWTLVLFFFVTHLALQYLYHVHGIEIMSTIRGKFDVDNEISIPTWFSQIILFIPAVLAVFIYRLERHQKSARAIYWLLLAALFAFLSVDEGAMLHEAFITKFREYTVTPGTGGLGNHTWLIPVGLLFVVLLVPFIRFLIKLPRKTATLLILGVGTYVMGAIVIETLGLTYVTGTFAYQGLTVGVEELVEMSGTIIIIHALLAHLHQHQTSTKQDFGFKLKP